MGTMMVRPLLRLMMRSRRIFFPRYMTGSLRLCGRAYGSPKQKRAAGKRLRPNGLLCVGARQLSEVPDHRRRKNNRTSQRGCSWRCGRRLSGTLHFPLLLVILHILQKTVNKNLGAVVLPAPAERNFPDCVTGLFVAAVSGVDFCGSALDRCGRKPLQ